jgi:3,4-dihydroxy 2-butanone 4-phosphate synthase/GTP cyclohydrolase II
MTGLSGYDIEIVDRVPIQIESNKNNKVYLKTKQDKLNHILNY